MILDNLFFWSIQHTSSSTWLCCSSCHSSANVLYSFNEHNTRAVTPVPSHSSLTNSLYFGDHISSCRTLDNVCVVPRLPRAPLSPQGKLWVLQNLLRWQTFSCTPRTPHFLSHGRIKQSCFRSGKEGQHLQQICTSIKEMKEKSRR